jgi:hypothetical protein
MADGRSLQLTAWLLTVAGVATVAAPGIAGVLQAERDSVLHEITADKIAQRRLMCPTGQASKARADLTSAGLRALSVGGWCVTVLTRAGRDGTLRYVTLNGQATSALTFDTGFVAGYLKQDALPAGAPKMATLLPVADRCLNQAERDTGLCRAAGYMLGLQAAQGEIVPAS